MYMQMFLGGTASSDFKVGVGGTSGSVGVASGMMVGNCLGGSLRSAFSVVIFDFGGRDMAGSG